MRNAYFFARQKKEPERTPEGQEKKVGFAPGYLLGWVMLLGLRSSKEYASVFGKAPASVPRRALGRLQLVGVLLWRGSKGAVMGAAEGMGKSGLGARLGEIHQMQHAGRPFASCRFDPFWIRSINVWTLWHHLHLETDNWSNFFPILQPCQAASNPI